MADTKPADLRAKRHKLLADFTDEVKVGFIEDTYEVRGHKWLIRTPTEDETCWADRYIQSSSPIAFVSSRRAPKLAVGIKALDGVPTSELFQYPTDMEDSVRTALDQDKAQKQYWLYSQMLTYLVESVPTPVVEELYAKYEELVKRQYKALEEAARPGPNS
jgi:hypothetical protein